MTPTAAVRAESAAVVKIIASRLVQAQCASLPHTPVTRTHEYHTYIHLWHFYNAHSDSGIRIVPQPSWDLCLFSALHAPWPVCAQMIVPDFSDRGHTFSIEPDAAFDSTSTGSVLFVLLLSSLRDSVNLQYHNLRHLSSLLHFSPSQQVYTVWPFHTLDPHRVLIYFRSKKWKRTRSVGCSFVIDWRRICRNSRILGPSNWSM